MTGVIFRDQEPTEQASVNQQLTVRKERKRGPLLDQAKAKTTQELKRHQALTLDRVEWDYLKIISALEKRAKKESRKI